MSGGWSYAISSNSTNKDAAWKVLQAANSQANLALFDVLVGNIGVRKDEASVPAYAKVPMNPFFTSACVNLLPQARNRSSFASTRRPSRSTLRTKTPGFAPGS